MNEINLFIYDCVRWTKSNITSKTVLKKHYTHLNNEHEKKCHKFNGLKNNKDVVLCEIKTKEHRSSNLKNKRKHVLKISSTTLGAISISLLFLNFCAAFSLAGGSDVINLDLDLLQNGDRIFPSERERPSSQQEKDLMILDALARRKGGYQNQEAEDSIVHLLGRSKKLFD